MRGSNGNNEVGGRGRLKSQKSPSYQNALGGIICLFFLLGFIQQPLHMPASIGMAHRVLRARGASREARGRRGGKPVARG